MKGLLKIADCVFSTAAALAVVWSVLLTGCDMDSREGCSPYPRELNVTLPALTVADAVVVEPMGSRSAVSVEDDALFSVGLGPERGADASWERSLSTRAEVTLSNVWVLQFDASGATKACAYVGTVAAGRKVQATLQSGENYTVWIVANGPAEGVLTTSNPATLSDFENKMLHTAAPASDETIPLSGGLSGVRILDNGQVLVGEDNTVVPEMTLTRAMARVDVLLEYDVDGAELDGVWLYQVPAGACYGLDDAVTDYPASGTVSNFAYRNGDASGLAPTSSGSGTVTHTWYVGDNRRGQNPAIQWEKNKGSNNAPAMATYARIKSHESSDTAKGLLHDVYLGENVTTDFNVLRNRHYIYRVRIGGTLDDQKLLAERDDRVWAGTLEYLDGAPTVDPDLSLPIHVNGQTFKVTFSGYWTGPGIPVRATVVGGEELASGTAACQAGNTGSATLEIPKNASDGERQIEFAYEWKGDWIPIGIGTQAGYGVTGGTVTPDGNIPGEGGTYNITLDGAWDDGVKVRVWDGSKSLATGTILTSGKAVSIKVPAYPNSEKTTREVKFQYQWGDEWITIGEPRTQDYTLIGTNYKGAVIYWVNPDDEDDFRAIATTEQDSGGYPWTGSVLSTSEFSAKKYCAEVVGSMRGITGNNVPHSIVYCYDLQVDADDNPGTYWLPSFPEIVVLNDNLNLLKEVCPELIESFKSGACWYYTANKHSDGTHWYGVYLNGNKACEAGEYGYKTRCVRGKDSGPELNVTNATHNAPASIPGQGGSYSVTLTGVLPASGVDVRAQSGGTALATGKVSASGTAVELAVPANASYSSRTVTFEYLWNGTWTKIGSDCSQQGYNVSNATHNAPASIPGQGGSYSVTLAGVLPASGVDVRAQSGGTALVTGKVTASGSAVSLTVPGNESYNSREVRIEYKWGNDWILIPTNVYQKGYEVTKVNVTPTGDIPAAGGTYTITFEGWGGYQIRAMSSGTQLAITADFTDKKDYSTVLSIPANTSWTQRTVTLEYDFDGHWVTIDTRTQEGQQLVTDVSYTYKECKQACESKGGIPSFDVCPSLDWSEWDTASMYWTSTEKTQDGIPSAAVFMPMYPDMAPSYSAQTSKKRCRCANN